MIIKDVGPEHPITAQGLNNLTSVLMDQQRYDEAEPLFRRALAIQQKLLGADHPITKETQANLARLISAKQEHSKK